MTTFKFMLVLVTMTLVGTNVMAQPTAATCQPGYDWSPGRGVCYSICRTGETWNGLTSSCVSVCKPGYIWVSDTQSCASKCTGGQFWAVSTSSCECSVGTIWVIGCYQKTNPQQERFAWTWAKEQAWKEFSSFQKKATWWYGPLEQVQRNNHAKIEGQTYVCTKMKAARGRKK